MEDGRRGKVGLVVKDVVGEAGAGGHGGADQTDAGTDDGGSVAVEVRGWAGCRMEVEGEDVKDRVDDLC